MRLQRRAYLKWSKITLVCGAHSFVWGVMTVGTTPAMLLGLATLIALLAYVESHPFYQRQRAGSPILARAIDQAVRYRVYLAIYIPLSYAFSAAIEKAGATVIMSAPFRLELYVGMLSMKITKALIGINMDKFNSLQLTSHGSFLDQFLGTYAMTLITGVLHLVILILMVALVFGVIMYRQRVSGAAGSNPNS